MSSIGRPPGISHFREPPARWSGAVIASISVQCLHPLPNFFGKYQSPEFPIFLDSNKQTGQSTMKRTHKHPVGIVGLARGFGDCKCNAYLAAIRENS